MANLSKTITVYSDGSQKIENATTPPSGNPRYRVLHDPELGDLWRAGVPEVFLSTSTHRTYLPDDFVWLTYYLFRYGVPKLLAALGENTIKARHEVVYDGHRAFTNKTGLDEFRNIVRNLRLDAGLPALDKTMRICGGATIEGTESYSIMQAIHEIPTMLSGIRTASFGVVAKNFLTALTTNNVLNVTTIDGDSPAPSLDWVLERPYLYFHATTIRATGTIGSFPQGSDASLGIYEPVLIPLISRHSQGPVQYPLYKLQKLQPGTVADPFFVP